MYTSACTKRRQRLLADLESLQQDISALASDQIYLNVWVPPQLLENERSLMSVVILEDSVPYLFCEGKVSPEAFSLFEDRDFAMAKPFVEVLRETHPENIPD